MVLNGGKIKNMKNLILIASFFISMNVFSMNKNDAVVTSTIELMNIEYQQLLQTCFIAMYDYDDNGQQVGDPTFYFFNTIGDLNCAESFALILQFYQILTGF